MRRMPGTRQLRRISAVERSERDRSPMRGAIHRRIPEVSSGGLRPHWRENHQEERATGIRKAPEFSAGSKTNDGRENPGSSELAPVDDRPKNRRLFDSGRK